MSIKALFDEAARDYDRARRQLIPCFDEFYGTVLDLIPYERGDAIRTLDLGAGTGLLSAFVADTFPSAHVTLVDISEEMLSQARRRFAAQTTRVEFLVMDYVEEPLPGEYEVVVSALSIHHLAEAEKQAVFQKVHDILCDGGIFINADQVLGRTPEVERLYRQAWLRQVQESGIGEGDLAAALERVKEDRMSTLAAQLRWLEGVGFQMVNCWYKNYSFVVYSGRRCAGAMSVSQKGQE